MAKSVYDTKNPLQGEVLEIKIGDLRPTQHDDGMFSLTTGSPIESYNDGREWFILHGNHRYYDALRTCGANAIIEIIVSRNPYLG